MLEGRVGQLSKVSDRKCGWLRPGRGGGHLFRRDDLKWKRAIQLDQLDREKRPPDRKTAGGRGALCEHCRQPGPVLGSGDRTVDETDQASYPSFSRGLGDGGPGGANHQVGSAQKAGPSVCKLRTQTSLRPPCQGCGRPLGSLPPPTGSRSREGQRARGPPHPHVGVLRKS